MALDGVFLEKFKQEAEDALQSGYIRAWVVALGTAASAALPLFAQGRYIAAFCTSWHTDNVSANDLGDRLIYETRYLKLPDHVDCIFFGTFQSHFWISSARLQ